jgi:hypothetical protein
MTRKMKQEIQTPETMRTLLPFLTAAQRCLAFILTAQFFKGGKLP